MKICSCLTVTQTNGLMHAQLSPRMVLNNVHELQAGHSIASPFSGVWPTDSRLTASSYCRPGTRSADDHTMLQSWSLVRCRCWNFTSYGSDALQQSLVPTQLLCAALILSFIYLDTRHCDV
jgi:hypothetical protein